MIKIGIVGLSGKMGKTLLEEIEKDPNLLCVGGTSDTQLDHPLYLKSFEELFNQSDLVIDFSSPDVIDALLTTAKKTKTPFVCGTTGLSNEHIESMKNTSQDIPLFYSANYSLGIFLMHKLIREAVTIFPAACYDIIETHHTEKKDAPSGTALALENTATSSGCDHVSIHPIRAGKIFGEHRFILTTDEERIELSHEAHTRATFAKGALRAAHFLISQKTGYFTMEDLISDKN